MNERLPHILLVDDEADNLKALERTLRPHFSLHATTNPNEVEDLIRQHDFKVIVCDQRMPGKLGTDLLTEVAKIKPLIARIILTAHTDVKELLDAINRAQIYRYITKPWNNEELVAALHQAVRHHELLRRNQELIRELESKNESLMLKEKELRSNNQSLEAQVEKRTIELKEANERLSDLAMTDPLTKIANRRAFFQRFADELDRSRRYKYPIAIAMIDVDHIKQYNDMEGHVFGDEALRKIAQTFSNNLRKTDLLARYGGEEFILMMPLTQLQHATETCERLRNSIEEASFQGNTEMAYLTVSIGLALFPGHGETPEDMVKSADRALYQAKQGGRNRVVAFNPEAKNDEESFFVT